MFPKLAFRVNSLFSSVCYRLGGALIDPGDQWEGFAGAKCVLLTHAHFDHIYGLNLLAAASPSIKVFTNSAGREMLLDAKKNMSRYHETPFVFSLPDAIAEIPDGQSIEISPGVEAKAIFTPGHSPSCITWLIGDMVFCGDSLIPGAKTVTNLPGGDKSQALKSESLIKQLSIGRNLFPGHKIQNIRQSICTKLPIKFPAFGYLIGSL
ncbi:MAG: MBL fold metallo-hydrolase [Clostridium sp.]|nr:MBL fold metallo-hydrolase [Clostridium sp.]